MVNCSATVHLMEPVVVERAVSQSTSQGNLNYKHTQIRTYKGRGFIQKTAKEVKIYTHREILGYIQCTAI